MEGKDEFAENHALGGVPRQASRVITTIHGVTGCRESQRRTFPFSMGEPYDYVKSMGSKGGRTA